MGGNLNLKAAIQTLDDLPGIDLPRAARKLARMSAPTEFKNVTAIAKANIYFDGKVVSHSILFPDGSKKTLGLIYPGQFHDLKKPSYIIDRYKRYLDWYAKWIKR